MTSPKKTAAPRKVLVAGGNGFVGSAISRELLNREIGVRVLSRTGEPSTRAWGMEDAEYVKGNIHSAPEQLDEALKGCTHLVNAVGIIREQGKNTFERVHVEGTENLVDAAKKAELDGFVQISALGVDEDGSCRYQTTKWRGEEAVRESGLTYSILRPSIVFGSGSEFVRTVAGLVYDLRWAIPALRGIGRRIAPPFFVKDAQRWPKIGYRSGKMQPVWVEDLAEVAANCLEQEKLQNRTLPLAGDRAYTFRELQEECAEAMGLPWRYPLVLPAWAARIHASILPHSLFPLNHDQLTMLFETYQADPGILRDALGFSAHTFREKMRPVLKRWMSASELAMGTPKKTKLAEDRGKS